MKRTWSIIAYILISLAFGVMIGVNAGTVTRDGYILEAAGTMRVIGKTPDGRPLWAQQFDSNSYIGEGTLKLNKIIPVHMTFMPTNLAGMYKLTEVKKYEIRPNNRESNTHNGPKAPSKMRLCRGSVAH